MKHHGLNQIELQELLESAIHIPHHQTQYEQRMLNELYGYQSDSSKFTEYLNNHPAFKFHLTSDGGKIKVIELATKSTQNICIIDWINFTVNEESFNTDMVLTDHDLILLTSETLHTIFGFGITLKQDHGIMFYQRSYILGDSYGYVCHGGQNNTILVTLNATGLTHARENWETRLFHFLEIAINPSITRIDLAHDIYNAPEFLIDHYLGLYDRGGFTNYRNKPAVSQAGNWLTENTNGRTLYIGNRKSGLYMRIYEKGRQLNSAQFPTWLRLEGEIKSDNRFITHDTLLRPHDFFAGLYPCLRSFNRTFSRIETFKNELNADFDHRVKWAKHQSGGFLKLLNELGKTPDEIIKMLQGDKIPKQWQRKFFGNTKTAIHNEPDIENYQPSFSGLLN